MIQGGDSVRRRVPEGLVGLSLFAAGASARQPAPETQAQRDARMAWWREARFGMFIHWGIYAQLAGEWKGRQQETLGEWIMDEFKIPIPEYEKLAAEFNP